MEISIDPERHCMRTVGSVMALVDWMAGAATNNKHFIIVIIVSYKMWV